MKIFSLKYLTRRVFRRITAIQSSAARLRKQSARMETRYMFRCGR